MNDLLSPRSLAPDPIPSGLGGAPGAGVTTAGQATSVADRLAMLEAALLRRQDAVLAFERLAATPDGPSPKALVEAGARVRALAAASDALLREVEREAGLVRPRTA